MDHKEVIDYILKEEKMTLEEVRIRTRKRKICWVRQLAMAMSKEFTRTTEAEIGRYLGGFDHSSVNHSGNVINNMYDTDKAAREKIYKYREYLSHKRMVETRENKSRIIIEELKDTALVCLISGLNLNKTAIDIIKRRWPKFTDLYLREKSFTDYRKLRRKRIVYNK